MCPSNFLPNCDSRLAKSLGLLGLGAERSKKYAPRPSGAQVAALMEVAARSCVTAEWVPKPVLAKATSIPIASCRRAIHTPYPPHDLAPARTKGSRRWARLRPAWRMIRLPAHYGQLMPLRDSCRKTVPVFIGHHARSGFAPGERRPDSAGAVIGQSAPRLACSDSDPVGLPEVY